LLSCALVGPPELEVIQRTETEFVEIVLLDVETGDVLEFEAVEAFPPSWILTEQARQGRSVEVAAGSDGQGFEGKSWKDGVEERVGGKSVSTEREVCKTWKGGEERCDIEFVLDGEEG
jgi:hypothetical protein